MLFYIFLSLLGVLMLLQYHHYTQRKPFWYEVRNIFQMIFTLAIFDLALMALSKWDFSRFGWFLLWFLSLIFLMIFHFFAKSLLSRFGLWQRDAIIVGTKSNALETFLAIKDEYYLGYNVIAFIKASPDSEEILSLKNINIPVFNCIPNDFFKKIKSVQFFLALEYEEESQQDFWIHTPEFKSEVRHSPI